MAEPAKTLDDQVEEEKQRKAAEKNESKDAESTAEIEVPDAVKPVGVNRFQLRSEKENDFRVDAKVDTTPEQVLDPAFWEHIARHLQITDTITVVREDIAWKMRVIVVDCGHNFASVIKEEFYDFGQSHEPSDTLPGRYKIDWAGTSKKWRVQFDKKPLKDGFATKQLAHRFAENHAQALKR